jgi:hypothetical protein
LETRACPSALTLNYASGGGNTETLSGQLTGAPNNAGQTITLSGYGGTTTATTDASGKYTATVTASQPGAVTAMYAGPAPASASVTPGTSPGNASPALTLNAAYTSGNNVTLSGQLTGAASNAGQTITLGGYGGTTTATTDANGNYSVTVAAIQNGIVSANFAPGGQQQVMTSVTLAVPALTALTALLPSTPSTAGLTLNYAYTSGNNVTFSGQLTGAPSDAGQTITLGGYGGTTTATTDANGNFSVTVAVTQLGIVTAGYAPGGQQQPVTASVTVNPMAPAITGFTVIPESGGYWEFEGTVTGTPDPQGMTINLGGLSSLQGQTIAVAANGTFDECFQLNGQTGTVMASTTDWWGRTANASEGLT